MMEEGAALLVPLDSRNIVYDESQEEEESDDSEEYFILAVMLKSRRRPHRIQNYIENVVSNYNAQEFQRNFRITVESYEELLRIIGPTLIRRAPTGRNTISAQRQLLAVIWLLATPDSYRSVGERFNLAKSSLASCFSRVVNALVDIAPRIIKWPVGEGLVAVERGFYQMSRIPNIIGAVDGTYIVIKAPKEDPQSYVTRKCHFAMTLQAVCDHKLKYTDIFVGFPGSVSDTRIFKNSDIYREVQNNIDHYFPNGEFIIGDKAYPTLTWCIPPFINRGNLTAAQQFFNTKLSQSRQTIERSFALLFGRFRRLKLLDMNRTNFIPSTVLACCVLHNICLNFADLQIDEYVREGLPAVLNNDEVEGVYQEVQHAGRNKRNEICRILYQNQ